MNNIKKGFKQKSALRCMADGGLIYEGLGANGERSFADAKYRQPGMEAYQPQPGAPQIRTGAAPAPATPAPAASPLPPSAGLSGVGRPGMVQPYQQQQQQQPLSRPMGVAPYSAASPSIAPAQPTPYTPSPALMAARANPRPQTPVSAPTPYEVARDSMTSQRTASTNRAQKNYAAGGKVSGPGGPTDDKIPAMLSDGEYVLPADTVKQVGVQNLDALKDATHTPVGGSKLRMGARKFVDGGLAEEEKLRGRAKMMSGMRTNVVQPTVEQPVAPGALSAESAPTMNAAWRNAQTAPPNETTAGAIGRNVRSFGAAALAPVESGLRYMSGSLGALKDAAVDVGRGVAGMSPETRVAAPAPNQPRPSEYGPPTPAPGQGTSTLPPGITKVGPNSWSGVGTPGVTDRGPDPDGADRARQDAMVERNLTSSLRFGNGGNRGPAPGEMRLNMPSAQDRALRAANERFDKIASELRSQSFTSGAKRARTLAGIEQARTEAMDAIMGNETARRGQDVQRGMNAADNMNAQQIAAMQGEYGLQAAGMRGEGRSSGMDPLKADIAISKEQRSQLETEFVDPDRRAKVAAMLAMNRANIPDSPGMFQIANAMLDLNGGEPAVLSGIGNESIETSAWERLMNGDPYEAARGMVPGTNDNYRAVFDANGQMVMRPERNINKSSLAYTQRYANEKNLSRERP